MAALDTSANSVGHKRPRRWVLLLIALLVFAAGAIAFRDAGYWLVREDPLQKGDVIVVLSGGLPYRANGAANIFKSGYRRKCGLVVPKGHSRILPRLAFISSAKKNTTAKSLSARACRIRRLKFCRTSSSIRRMK